MRIRNLSISVALLAVTLLATAAAAADGPFTRGAFDFTPSLSLNRTSFTREGSTTAASVTQATLGLSAARCMTERFELGAGLLMIHRPIGDRSRNAFGASANAIFNLPAHENVIPFLSGGVGVTTYSADGTTDKAMLLPMLRVGFRTLMGSGRTLNASIGYSHEMNPNSPVERSADLFDVGVGISVFKTRGK